MNADSPPGDSCSEVTRGSPISPLLFLLCSSFGHNPGRMGSAFSDFGPVSLVCEVSIFESAETNLSPGSSIQTQIIKARS